MQNQPFFPLRHNQSTNSYNRQPRPQTLPFKTLHLLEMLCWMKNRARDTGDFIKTKTTKQNKQKNLSNAYSCNIKVQYTLNCFKALVFLSLLTTLLPDPTLLTYIDSDLLQPCAVTLWREFYLLIFAALCQPC